MITPLEQLNIPNATTRMDRALENTLVITFQSDRVIRITIEQESETYLIWTDDEIESHEWNGYLSSIGESIRTAHDHYSAVEFTQMLENVGLELSR